ncbi:MAG: hydroxymethylbilane synthase [Pacificimonas sp.]
MIGNVYRIGTRGSPLALAQARMVADALGVPSELSIVRTAGDREQRKPLAELGGKGVWTKELERALLDGEIDMAVHSMKDVESERPSGLFIAAMLPRADVRDRLIGPVSLDALRPGMTVGTSSPRRAAQMQRRVPGLTVIPFRGNVARRLRRLAENEADATLLAAAGLDRLGQAGGVAVETTDMLPAPGQGAIGIEVRADNTELRARLAGLSDAATFTAVSAERAMASALGGSCHSPVAALAIADGDGFFLRGEILSLDGQVMRSGERHFAPRDAARAGDSLGRELLSDAPPEIAALFDGPPDG